MRINFALLLIASFVLSVFAPATKGVVTLDSWSFDKIVDDDATVLVKFDQEYAHDAKEEAFKEFAKRIGERGNKNKLIVAQVTSVDYGENRNEDLIERFGVKKEDFPVYKLFLRSTVIPYDGEVTVDSLSNFVKSNTGIYIGAPGTIEEFDILAAEFFSADTKKRGTIISSLKEKAAKLDETTKASADVYLGIMEHVIERGDGFIESETKRVQRLKEGKLTEEKKNQFNLRLNILASFQHIQNK